MKDRLQIRTALAMAAIQGVSRNMRPVEAPHFCEAMYAWVIGGDNEEPSQPKPSASPIKPAAAEKQAAA